MNISADNKKETFEKYIVMNRSDGTGSRIYSLMNTLFIAEKLGNINYAKFLWNETRFFQGDKPDSNNTNMRNFENNTIIGASCESKESIFSADFIAKFYLPQIPNNSPPPNLLILYILPKVLKI